MMFYSQKKCLCYMFLATFIGLLGISSVGAQETPEYETNSLYVKFKESSGINAKSIPTTKNKIQTIHTSDLKLTQKVTGNYEILPFALSMSLFDNPILEHTFQISTNPEAKADIDKLMIDLQKDPRIEYVERVPIMRILSATNKEGKEIYPNDPFYGTVDGLHLSWHLDVIHAPQAWEIQKGKPTIKAAVVDNAIVGSHEDLQIPSNLLYNIRTGQVGSANPPASADPNFSCVYLDDKNCPSYSYSHGTHCAGAVAAINNNGIGIASIGSGVTLMGAGGASEASPINIYDPYSGVAWAANNGAKVISCSWGGKSASKTNEQAMKACYDNDIIIVTAAGNDASNAIQYPAGYYPYVISVGSIDEDLTKSSFSNYGYWVDILSPGGASRSSVYSDFGIFSTMFCINQNLRLSANIHTFDGKKYDDMQGTSMATPVAAGLVSLLLSKDPSLNTDQMRAILQNTSQYNSKNDTYFSKHCGTIDAYHALMYMDSISFGAPITKLELSTSRDSVWIKWEAPNTGDPVKGYHLYRDGEPIASNTLKMSYLDTNRKAGIDFAYSVEALYEGSKISTKVRAHIKTKTYNNINIYIRPDSVVGTAIGQGRYETGSSITMEAIPNTGYKFDRWIDGAGVTISSKPKQSILVTKNKDIFAWFVPATANEKENLKEGFRLSPNPAKDEIHISYKQEPMLHLQISNFQGKTFYQQDVRSQEQTLDISDLSKGMYLLTVSTASGSFSSKFIKK